MEIGGEALPSILSENERDEALRNLRLVRRCLDGGVPLARVAAEAGVSRWTLRRWIQRYRAEGLAGLCRRRRNDAGRRRLPEVLQHLIEGLALQRPAPRISWVCRQAQSVARDKGWPIPSYARVYKIVRGLDSGLLTYAHEGSKAYREAFDLIYRRESCSPNEIWLADHSVLNVATVDRSGRVTRPWLTVIVDDFSRSVPGYLLGFEAPSSLRTALALRQAIWRKEDVRWRVCGIPARFYTDLCRLWDYPDPGAQITAAQGKRCKAVGIITKLRGHPEADWVAVGCCDPRRASLGDGIWVGNSGWDYADRGRPTCPDNP